MSGQRYGIVVAAGSGERLGAGPKAFVTVGGRPMLLWAVRALGGVDAGVAVVSEGDTGRAEELLAGLSGWRVQAGGPTRQESVRRGLAALPAGNGRVAVHDAARPLASARLVERTFAALGEQDGGWDAVAPAVRLVDTLKRVEPATGLVLGTVDRSEVVAVQTPQVFPRALFEEVHGRAELEVTDDLALVEAAGGRVRVIEGEQRAFKLTYPEDLVRAEALLGARP